MIPILKIAGKVYAFKKAEHASRVLTLLADAQELVETYHWKQSTYFYHPAAPNSLRARSEIQLEMIDPNKITEAFSDDRNEQPDDPKPLSRGLRLPARVAPRQITGGSHA